MDMGQHHSDSTYFMRRASEEQAAAQRAHDPRARQSHIDLAERYSQAAQMDGVDDDGAQEAPAPMALLQPEFRILP